MNGPLVSAGGLALAAAAIHGLVGDHFLRRTAPDALPPNAMGGPETSKTLVRVSWHFVTVTFVLSGFALLDVGWDSATRFAPGIARFVGVLYSCFALFAVAAGVAQRRFLFRHPAPLGLSAIAVLIWWGAAGM